MNSSNSNMNFKNIMDITYNNFEKNVTNSKYQYEKIKFKNDFLSILNNMHKKKYIDDEFKNDYTNKANLFLEKMV